MAPIIPKPPPNPKYPCGFPKAWKDKVCDDENNNAACFWDGGDCCGANVNTKYCEECKCLDPNAQPPPVLNKNHFQMLFNYNIFKKISVIILLLQGKTSS